MVEVTFEDLHDIELQGYATTCDDLANYLQDRFNITKENVEQIQPAGRDMYINYSGEKDIEGQVDVYTKDTVYAVRGCSEYCHIWRVKRL